MESLLNPDIQQFIQANLKTDITKLSLKKNPFPGVDYKAIINQIEAKNKAIHKLPTWFQTEGIYYPSKISIEQTSSEITAQYKSMLVSGQLLIDLTGGFGVDDYYFAKRIKQVIHCEINQDLSEIAQYNFHQLGTQNISCYAQDGQEVLKSLSIKPDWIYIDPSRRNQEKGKVFMLKDCLPDVTDLLGLYQKYSENILIKTSPIYDLSLGLSELRDVSVIHIVAVDNEVKELLFELRKKSEKNGVILKAVNLTAHQSQVFEFEIDHDYQETYAFPGIYLYEPNASIMKSQGFGAVCQQFGVQKLHIHSHLFTSDKLIDFPGRVFKILQIFPYKKQELKPVLTKSKANIATRNFPESVAEIRQRWKIAEGGTTYCFFTTNLKNEKIVVFCDKI